MSDVTIDMLKKKIAKAKSSLINKAKRKGIWENFGQNEINDLESLAFQIIHDGSRPISERNEASVIIMTFVDWAETYTG